MSRLIVKNLPKYYTRDEFKKLFESKGTVTDAKIMFTKDGINRKFGYIGFKSEAEAKIALEYFNNSFIDTSRITVEFAKSVHESSDLKTWSKYSSNSVKDDPKEDCFLKEIQKEKEKMDMLKYLYSEEPDEKLLEFLQVNKSKGSGERKTWDNDFNQQITTKAIVQEIASKEDYQDLPKDFQADLEKEEIQEQEGNIKFDQNISDLEYLKSKIKTNPQELQELNQSNQAGNVHPSRLQIISAEEPVLENKKLIEKEDDQDCKMTSNDQEKTIETESDKEKEDENPLSLIGDTGRLFVRNLPFSTTEEELREFFGQFGDLTEVHLPIYKDTKLQKGYAFIQYMMPEHAVTTYAKCHGDIFQGRILDIIPGKEKKSDNPELSYNPNDSFQLKKEKQRKKEANQDFNWNSLFMNSDAVAESMAKKLGVKKREILDPHGENAAVKLALAETHIINETKTYFESQGVSLSAFQQSSKSKRSNTVIIVKNIPANTKESEIASLFEKFGSVGRLLFPPAKTVGIVEFLEPNEAKIAFQKCAYSKFKSVPLYLEWAPANIFTESFKPEMKKPIQEEEPVKILESTLQDPLNDPDAMPVATVFVKNLNFETREPALFNLFSIVGGLRSTRIPTKKAKNGAILSLGYGFLEFDTKENALKCVKTMQNSKLDNHVLSLKFSNSVVKSSSNSIKKPVQAVGKTSKLIIRNIPFEASKSEIKSLFKSFGTIKSLRLPLNFNGTHRGFGFIDFSSFQDALNAFNSLKSTHIYGRHLVLEWAKEEQDPFDSQKTEISGQKRKLEMEFLE